MDCLAPQTAMDHCSLAYSRRKISNARPKGLIFVVAGVPASNLTKPISIDLRFLSGNDISNHL